MKAWLERNKVYFETVAALFVSLAGLLLIVLQLIQASGVAELSEKELELTRLQTAIANAAIRPHFIFKNEAFGNENPVLVVSHDGAEIRKLRGECIAYLVIQGADGKPVNVELQDFYYQAHGGTSNHGSLNFYTYRPFVEAAITNFAVTKMSGDRATIERTVKLRDRPLELRNVFQLTYYDLTGQLQTEFYEANWPVDSVEPIAALPTMQDQIDVLPSDGDNPAEAGATELVATVDALVAKHVAK